MSTAAASNVQHIKSFSVAVLAFRAERVEKRSPAEIEKILAVLCKISDVSAFESNPDFFLDLHWLLNLPPDPKAPSSVPWTCVALLTRLASRSPTIRILLRERLRLLSGLSDLLLRLPATSHEKGAKLLELMRFVSYGIRIYRLEDFILHLVPKLLEYVESKDSSVKSASLFLLTSICRGNHVVSKFLLSLLNEQKRKLFFAEELDDLKIQALINHLNFCLSQANLSYDLTATSWSGMKFEDRLSRISDAMCAAYGEDDCLLMESFTDFLKELCAVKSSTVASTTLLSLIQQVLIVADFSEGHMLANEALFKFLRQMLSLGDDPLPVLDVIVKALQMRLEGPSALEAFQAVALMQDVTAHIVRNIDQIDGTRLQSIRLQVDQVLALLCDLASRPTPRPSQRQAGRTLDAVVDVLVAVCDIDNWQELIRRRLKPASMVDRVNQLLEATADQACSHRLAASFLLLVRRLADGSQDDVWQQGFDAVMARSGVQERLVEQLRSTSCRPRESAKILAVLGGGGSVVGLRTANQAEEEDQDGFSDWSVAREELQAVNSLVDKIAKSVEKQSVHHELAEVLELGTYRLSAQQRQVESLKVSLRLADKRIEQQSQQTSSLETELEKVNGLMRKVFQKSQSTELELKDIRAQHVKAQDEATNFKRSLSKTCAQKDATILELENEHAKVISKALKYKEQNLSLQQTIAEHIQVQDELQAKLRAEAKANADLSLALEKREEKLKKKEHLLDEEITRREKLDSELESARQEVSSLQTLTKRQQQALAKKEKQLQDQTEELQDCRKIQEQIFNLSKFRNNANGN